jgi:hypothetical protein
MQIHCIGKCIILILSLAVRTVHQPLGVDELIFFSLLEESLADMRDPVLTALNIQIVVICVMTTYSLVGGYCCVGAACCSHL